jgi:hypothetical protein
MMSNVLSRLTLAALVAVTASCGGRYSAAPGGAPAPSRIERQPNVISSDELQDPVIFSRDAYTAIRHLRPGFFTYHGPNSFQQANTGVIHISSDYGPLQELKELAKMTTLGMLEVRYLNAEQAQARFGLNANGGPVIVLLYSKGAN